MTTLDAIQYGIPRWMALSHLVEDLGQIIALAEIEYRTPAQRHAAIRYYVAELRRTQWDRAPRKPARKPGLLRPSKRARGYRTDSAAHRAARLRMSPERRRTLLPRDSSRNCAVSTVPMCAYIRTRARFQGQRISSGDSGHLERPTWS
jgi:hypothetical protein